VKLAVHVPLVRGLNSLQSKKEVQVMCKRYGFDIKGDSYAKPNIWTQNPFPTFSWLPCTVCEQAPQTRLLRLPPGRALGHSHTRARSVPPRALDVRATSWPQSRPWVLPRSQAAAAAAAAAESCLCSKTCWAPEWRAAVWG
jgi:hypothetical protein